MKLLKSIGRLVHPAVAAVSRRGDIPPGTLRRFPFIQEQLDSWVEQKRFCEDIRNNADFARSLGSDPTDLGWFFRIVVREDPRTWRTRLRVREAAELLRRDKDTPLEMIAEAVGFSDPSNFARQFRKEMGLPPHLWRERNYGK